MKEEYVNPILEEEKVEIEDVIASSSAIGDNTGWLPWI